MRQPHEIRHLLWASATTRFIAIWPTWIIVGLLAAWMLTMVSCRARTDRLEITGTVTLNGATLDGASIRFTSLGASKMLASGALVQNGEYKIPAEKGLTPGKYHVEITAPDDKAHPIMVSATPGGPSIPVAPERVPAEYNVNSDKTVEVSAGGNNHFVFDIVTRTAK